MAHSLFHSQLPEHRASLTEAWRFHKGRHRFSVDDKGWRCHTAVTNLLSDARLELTLDNQPVVELDVRNSQPLALAIITAVAMLCGFDLDRTAIALAALSAQALAFPPGLPFPSGLACTSAEALASTQGLALPAEAPASTPVDQGKCKEEETGKAPLYLLHGMYMNHQISWVDVYQSLFMPELIGFTLACSEGWFYEELAKILGMPCTTEEKRNLVKARSNLLLCDEHFLSGDWRKVRRRWPPMAKTLAMLKRDCYLGSSWQLQRLESVIMAGAAVDCFYHALPDAALLLVYDSVLVAQANKVTAERSIETGWSRFGVRPTLKARSA
jgi:hypothetical protein